MNKINNENVVKIEHGRWYVCIKDYYAGGNLQAKRGSVVEAKRGMFMMGLKDASAYFRYATTEEIENGHITPKFIIGDVMRTKEEAKNGITSGLPVVVYVDRFNYHCNNETIPLTEQEDYEYPPLNRQMKFDRDCVKHPNFEYHDWIVNADGKIVGRVVSSGVNINACPYVALDNSEYSFVGIDFLNNCHKWTIADAHDCDFVVVNNSECLLIGPLNKENSNSDEICLYFSLVYGSEYGGRFIENETRVRNTSDFVEDVTPISDYFLDELKNAMKKCGYSLSVDLKKLVASDSIESVEKNGEECRFEVNDWLVQNDDGKLVGVIDLVGRDRLNNIYAVVHDGDVEVGAVDMKYMSKCHKWSLDDAKDGDYVLVLDSKIKKVVYGPLNKKETDKDMISLYFSCSNLDSDYVNLVKNVRFRIHDEKGDVLVEPVPKRVINKIEECLTKRGYALCSDKKHFYDTREIRFGGWVADRNGNLIGRFARFDKYGDAVLDNRTGATDVILQERFSLYHNWTINDAEDGMLIAVPIAPGVDGIQYVHFVCGTYAKSKSDDEHLCLYMSYNSMNKDAKAEFKTCQSIPYTDICGDVVPMDEHQKNMMFDDMFKHGFALDKDLKRLIKGTDSNHCEQNTDFHMTNNDNYHAEENHSSCSKLYQYDVENLVYRFRNSSDNFKDKRVSDIYRRGVLDAIALINERFGEQFDKFGFSISKKNIC